MARPTHRRRWRRNDHLVIDEETGSVHYRSEMRQRPETGIWVHKSNWEPRHPQLYIKPRYPDPRPVDLIIPDDKSNITNLNLQHAAEISGSGIDFKVYGPAMHLFPPGIGKMMIQAPVDLLSFRVR
ncbi:MAG TPA: hypothetical protein VLS45_06470 [Methylomicrobium sp.]|nr:hypothetical protein [Methylomicrobium sp.]